MSSLLIRGGCVVSMDDAVGVLGPGDVLVEGGRIAAVAPRLEPPVGAEVIEAAGMIVLPGLVNAHLHTWQTALRGIAADWTIKEYMGAMHAGLATRFRPEDIHVATLAGALAQISAGTTTLVDWCHNNPTPEHTDAAIAALQESGIRARFLHGSPKPDPKPGQPHFSEIPLPRAEIERVRRERLADEEGLVTLGLAILGPGMSVYEVCLADFRLARELGLVASMHVSGGLRVPDGFERLAAEGLLGPHCNIVHGNILTDDQLRLLVDRGVSFTVTAEVEMQMGFGRPLTGRLRRLGSPVSIGSDIESAMTGDMFAAARMTLQAQRFLDSLDAIAETGTGPETITVPAVEALRWATIDGARMAGLGHRIGSITPGKEADILLVRTGDANIAPAADPVAAIVLQAGPANVDTVLVGGRVLKRGGRLLRDDGPALTEALARSGARIMAVQGQTR